MGDYTPRHEIPFAISDDLSDVADALANNMFRIKSLIMHPGNALALGHLMAKIDRQARFNLTGSPTGEPPQDQLDAESMEISAKISRGETVFPDSDERPTVRATVVYSDLLEGAESTFLTGTDALLSSIIVLAYTTFESLSTDLWLRAVNLRPKTLATYVLNNSVKGDKESFAKQAPSVRLMELQQYDFDLRNHMGDLLKERDRVSFESFYNTEEAYLSAFRHPESKGDKPSEAFKRMFAKHKASLRSLEHVRNLIAHRSGKVDGKFLRFAEKELKEFSQIPLNGQLELNGEFVAKRVLAVFDFSKELLRTVNQWLQDHSE